MSHFGERAFSERACHKTCDNCQNAGGAGHENRDVTQASCIGLSPSHGCDTNFVCNILHADNVLGLVLSLEKTL